MHFSERLLFFFHTVLQAVKMKTSVRIFLSLIRFPTSYIWSFSSQETHLEWALSMQESDFVVALVFLLHIHIHIIWMARHSLHTTTHSCLKNYFCSEIISSWLTQIIKTSYNICHRIHIFILTRIKKSL